MLNTLIIEDDTTIQTVLRRIIQHECPDVRLCATARTLDEAATALLHHRPDIVITDVMLPGGEVFGLLNDLRASTPDTEYAASSIAIVFMTAHNDKAIDSTRYPNCGVLLKPFEPNDLLAALARCRQQVLLRRQASIAQALLRGATLSKTNSIKNTSTPALTTELEHSKLTDSKLEHSKLADRLHRYGEIVSVEGSDGAITVTLLDGTTRTEFRRLAEYTDEIPAVFVRVHKSTVLNLLHVVNWTHKDKDALAHLRNGSTHAVSRTYKKAFIAAVEHLRSVVKL
jgi:DNA-binding LytR/AlgR family response regulator